MPEDLPAPKPGELADKPALPRLLTAQELTHAANWINERAKEPSDPCQVCGSAISVIQPSIVIMPGGVSPTGEISWIHPMVTTICMHCGYTRYFNAIVMGLVPGVLPEGDVDGSAR